MEMSKSMMNWQQGIKSIETFRHYQNNLKKFLRFTKIQNYDILVDLPILELKEMLEDFVVSEKKNRLSYSRIKGEINAIDSFLQNNDVYIETRRAKKWLPARLKQRNDTPYTTKQLVEILDCLKSKSSFRLRVATHILCSSGARVGFSKYLKFKDIGEFQKDGCKSILIYSGEIDEYYSFINPETVEVLDQWIEYRKSQGEKVTGSSWVIPTGKDYSKTCVRGDISCKITQRIKTVDRGEKIRGRFDTAVMHGMRKRWDTVAKDTDGVNYNKIEKMFAHSTTHKLDTVYYKPKLDELFKEYDKFYRGLYISDSYKLRVELEQKETVIEENQAQKDDKIKSLEDRLERFEAFMKSTVKFD